MAVSLEIKCYDAYRLETSPYMRYQVRVVVTATSGTSTHTGSLFVSASWCGGKYTNFSKRLNNVAISPGTYTQVLNEVIPFATGISSEINSINNGSISLINVYASFGDSVEATLSRTLNNIVATPRLYCYKNLPATTSKVYLGEQFQVNLSLGGDGAKDANVTYDIVYALGDTSQNIRTASSNGSWYWTPAVETFAPAYGPSTLYIKPNIIFIAKDAHQNEIYRYPSQDAINTYLPESIRPTITSVIPSDTEGYRATYGVYVGTKSTLQSSVEASGIYGSTITKVVYQIDDLSVSTTDPSATTLIGRLNQSGSRTLKTTVTDSRGRTGVENIPIAVMSYVQPSVSLIANRWDTIDNEASDGSDTVRLDIGGNIPSINGHLVEGTITVQGRQKDAPQWTVISTISVSGTIEEIVYAHNQSVDSNWDYRVILTDSFGTTVESADAVGTATPILEFHSSGKGLGIGTIAPEVGLDVGMQADFKGTAEDGFSRIRIVNPEGTETIALAKLTGSDLVLLAPSSVTDYDRAFVNSHIFMQNNRAIGGVTTAGVQTTMLRLNSSNQVELTWTSGGLKGRVFKQIWRGTWTSGSITVSEAPYYNVFGFAFGNPSGQSWTGLGFRYDSIIHAFTFSWNISSAPMVSVAAKIGISGTRLSLSGKSHVGVWTNAWVVSSTQSNSGITRIWGIL